MQICYHRVLASWTRQFFGYMAVVLIVAAMSLSLLPVSQTLALTTTPTKMNFQGRLTDSAGTTMPDGLYNMKFRLFTVASGGTDVWNETRETTNRVQVTNGLFSVQLGAVTPISASLFASGSLYFEVELPTPATATCGTASCQTWTEGPMTTRSILSTSAYAFNSETLDGLDSTGFIQNQNGSAQTSTNFWIDGTARAATVQAANGLIVPGSNNTATFTVQNTNTVAVFNIDTTNGEIELGNYNGGTNPVNGKLVIGNSTNANLVSIVSGATSTSYTMTLPTAVGASGDCLKTSDASGTLTFGSCAAGGGVTTVGALDGGTPNANAATITGTTIYLQSASASYGGLVNTTTQTFAGVKTFNDSITLAAAKTISMTGGDTATRPGSPTEGMIYYDTDTDRLITYSNGKWQTDRTDAVLVAASNSSQADKDAADYVADGTDDQVQINAALTAADPASGSRKTGKVFLFAGTYTTHRTDSSNATILIPNNTTLAGAGRGTLIQLGDIDTTDNLIENSDTTTGTGVVIRDLRIDGQDTANTVGTQHGIYLNGMGDGTFSPARQGGKIVDVWVNDFRDYGISLYNSDNSIISSVTSQGNTGSGIVINQTINNVLSDNIAHSNVGAGFIVNGSTSTTFTGNIARSNAQGINLTGSLSGAFSGNTAQGNSQYGIVIVSSTDNTIAGNTSRDNTTIGIILNTSDKNIVSGNAVSDNGGASNNNGIYLADSDLNNVVGNRIIDSGASGTNYAINIIDSASSNNYLADNHFSSTPATSTINDAGTGTVYANQPRAENGGQLTNRTANNATAFAIQNASGVNVFNADTSAGEIEFGSASLAGKLVISDGSSNTVTLSVSALAGNYTLAIPTITANDEICLKDAANCGGGSGVTTVGALDGGTANANGATISGTTIYLQSASASYGGLVNTTTQTFAGAKTFNDSITLAAAKTISMTGGDTATRPGSPTEGMLYYDTDTDRLITYSNGKWQTDRTDAVLVAASNSSQADKDAADYVADGTDDQVQINAALTAADPASGTRKTGKVFLFAGTYTTHRTDNGDATILIPNNTTLAGAGRGTLVQLGDIDATDNLMANSSGTGTGVSIRDMRLDGQSSLNSGGTQYAIYFSGVGDYTTERVGGSVLNVEVNSFDTNGIYLNNSDSNIFSNVSADGSPNGGIYLTASSHNRISDSTFSGLIGIYVDSSTYNIFSSNVISGTWYGIDVWASTDNTFSSNTLRDNSYYGIRLNNVSSRNLISDNTILDSGSTTDNNGIYVASGSNNSIVGNYIRDSSCGTGTSNCRAIHIQSGAYNYLSNNYFSDTDADATANIYDATASTIMANQPISVDGMTALFRSPNSATALTVQNASSVNVLNVDTSAGEIELGAATLAGKLVINDGASSTVTLSLNTITGDNNYTLSIPAMTGSDTMCLQTLANCSGASTLGDAYAGDADGGDAIIALTTTDGGIRLQDAATPLATAFSVEDNTGSAAYFSVSSAGVAMEDTNSRPTLLMDNSTHELRVYEDVASSPRYAVMYYDTANNMAVFGASSGTTQIGTSGAGGDINLSLSGAAADKLVASKTFNLAGAYSGTDYSFTRGLTGTSYAMTGNVMKIEDSSTFTGGSSAPNLLYINQGNTGATGNLILAQTGGSTDKFKVDVSGNVTAAGDVSIAAGKSYTGAGAVTVSSASGSNLTLLAQGAAKVIIKPGTNSTSMFELQNASGTSMLLADSTNNQIKVGVSDTTGTLLVLDTKTDSGDPTGAAGGMYYNSNSGTFRCYEGSAWKDCTGDRYVYKTGNQGHTATSKVSITDLSWSVAASTNYRFRCVIFFAAGAAANGWLVTATGPTTPTLFVGQTYGPSSTTVVGGSQWAADDGGTATGASATTSANNGIVVEGILRNSTNAGTIQMRWANELATSTHTIQQGSYCSYNTF